MGRRRRGFSLVEVCVASLLIGLVLTMAWRIFVRGRASLERTRRKLSATQVTHFRFEQLRHSLENAPWAWVLPTRSAAGGPSRALFAGPREYSFDPASGRLSIGGSPTPGTLSDVRFYAGEPFRVKFVLSSSKDASGPAFQERSTLVSTAFLERHAEEVRMRNHIWESEHTWCIHGSPLHYGFTD